MVPVSKDFVAKMFSLEGKTALVTGASGALGCVVAKAYGYQGAKVMLTARDEGKLQKLVEEFKAEGIDCAYAAGDPANEDDVRRVVAETVARFGELNILCACHGLNKPKNILDQSVADWQAIMDANTKSVYLLAKYAAAQMVAQGKGGKLVITSSARSKMGMAGYTGYCTSKGGVDLMVQSLASDLGKYHINVNSINPTVFRSPLTEWMWGDEAVYQNFLKRLPIGRLGEPEDFAGLATFLASDASNFLTGGNYDATGGYWAC